MARTLFPMSGTSTAAESKSPTDLPLARECAWDFEADRPIFRGGEPVEVTGAEAVRVWAYNALLTERYVYEIWSAQYGSELERLIGQPFSAETKEAEVTRYITECLMVSPYITGVAVSDIALEDGRLSARVKLSTVYGEEDIHV